jgi:hypothetical protein
MQEAGTGKQPLHYMHGDKTAAALRDTVKRLVKQGSVDSSWLSLQAKITQTNIWRCLPLEVPGGPPHMVNKGSNLTGMMAFSLKQDWFVDTPAQPVA